MKFKKAIDLSKLSFETKRDINFFLKEKFLIDYNQNLNRKVLEIIGHNPTIHKTNVYVKRSSLDFRRFLDSSNISL